MTINDEVRIAERSRHATLPNCDRCGRFTNKPTHTADRLNLGAGMTTGHDLLLCPKCADPSDCVEAAEAEVGRGELVERFANQRQTRYDAIEEIADLL